MPPTDAPACPTCGCRTHKLPSSLQQPAATAPLVLSDCPHADRPKVMYGPNRRTALCATCAVRLLGYAWPPRLEAGS